MADKNEPQVLTGFAPVKEQKAKPSMMDKARQAVGMAPKPSPKPRNAVANMDDFRARVRNRISEITQDDARNRTNGAITWETVYSVGYGQGTLTEDRLSAVAFLVYGPTCSFKADEQSQADQMQGKTPNGWVIREPFKLPPAKPDFDEYQRPPKKGFDPERVGAPLPMHDDITTTEALSADAAFSDLTEGKPLAYLLRLYREKHEANYRQLGADDPYKATRTHTVVSLLIKQNALVRDMDRMTTRTGTLYIPAKQGSVGDTWLKNRSGKKR